MIVWRGSPSLLGALATLSCERSMLQVLLCSSGELLPYADLSGHAGPVRGLVWREDLPAGQSPILISGSEDQSVRAWDVILHHEQQQQAALAAAAAAAAAAALEPAAGTAAESAAPAADASAGPMSSEQPQPEQQGARAAPAAPQQAEQSGAAAGPAPKVPAVAAAAPPPAATGRKGAAESLGARPLLPKPAAPDAAASPAQAAALAASCVGLADALLGRGLDAARLAEAGALGCHADPLAASLALAASAESLAARAAATANPQARRSAAHHAAAVALWRGDVGEAVRLLLEHDALTADFVSMAAAAGEVPGGRAGNLWRPWV